jgi:serine phosphatase RsbU (regulator of sigma subunit)
MHVFVLLATGNLILGGLVFLLGLTILRENPRQTLNRVVAFMLFFGGLGSILTALGFLAVRGGPQGTAAPAGVSLAQNFAYLWEFFFPTLFLFASIFPRERGFVRRFRGFSYLVYAPHTFHFLLLLGITFLGKGGDISRLHTSSGVMEPIVQTARVFFELFLAVHRALFSLVNLGYGVAGAVLLVGSYRRTRLPRLRQQLRVIGLGLIACLTLYSVATSIPILLDLEIAGAVRSLLVIAALTLGSGSIAVAMVRYKFLDTKLLARRGILYATASAIVVGLYLTVVTQLSQLISSFLGMDTRVVEPFFLVMALILFQPAIARLEEGLEQVFLRDPGDYRNVLRRMGKDLLTTIDLNEMLARSVETLSDALFLRRAAVVALSREGPIVHAAGEVPPPGAGARLAGILARLSPGSDVVRLDSEGEDLTPDDRETLIRDFGTVLLFPLHSKGESVGALLLGEKVTGTETTAEDVALLTSLAAQMSVSVQNGLLLRERVAMARLDEELNLARRIQSTFLPSSFPAMKRFEVHAVNTPSREVGGDFYDFVPDGSGRYYLAIADVSGKGIPAALLTSMLQASLRTLADGDRSVSSIVSNINVLVSTSTTVEQFVTFFLARVDESSFRMEFSNAGHNYPVLCRKGGDRVFLERGGIILGMMERARYEEDAVDLRPGDRVVLYTDGISEARNPSGEEYGEERLWDLARTLPAELSAREMTGRIIDDLYRFLDGGEPQDDVTVMVLRVLEENLVPSGEPPEAVGARTAPWSGS